MQLVLVVSMVHLVNHTILETLYGNWLQSVGLVALLSIPVVMRILDKVLIVFFAFGIISVDLLELAQFHFY